VVAAFIQGSITRPECGLQETLRVRVKTPAIDMHPTFAALECRSVTLCRTVSIRECAGLVQDTARVCGDEDAVIVHLQARAELTRSRPALRTFDLRSLSATTCASDCPRKFSSTSVIDRIAGQPKPQLANSTRELTSWTRNVPGVDVVRGRQTRAGNRGRGQQPDDSSRF
jgi:hypothetical protein